MCSCFIEIINRIGKSDKNARLVEHFITLATSLINYTFMFLVDN